MAQLTEVEIEEIIASTEGSLKIEGMKMDDETKEYARRVLRDEISADEAVDEILRKFRKDI